MSELKPGKTNHQGEGGGAPTKYEPRFARMAYKACLLGSTDEDLAEFFEVATSTISEWKLKQPKFSEALKKGRDIADQEVAKSLRDRALGYSHSDVDIRVVDGEIVETKVIKHYPPDTAAAIYWLNNRQKKNWRQKQEHDVEVHGNMTVETVSYAGSGGAGIGMATAARAAAKREEAAASAADRSTDNPD